MAVGTASLHKAVTSAWTAHGIDHEFKKYWAESKRSSFPSIHDQEAAPDQPFPYCIFNQGLPTTVVRATGAEVEKKQEYRDVPWEFQIYAKRVGSVAAKTIAIELLEVLLKKFGGHPEDTPIQLTMDNGEVYQIQYQNDFGVLEGDDEYSWRLSYTIQIDVPVKVA